MLVLSRKINEEIVVGNKVIIKIVGVSGKKVRLGISAPQCISVRRGELVSPAAAACDSPLTVDHRRKPALC